MDLSPLAGLTRLDMLILDGTKVERLSPLIHLTKLQMLGLEDTRHRPFTTRWTLRAQRSLPQGNQGQGAVSIKSPHRP